MKLRWLVIHGIDVIQFLTDNDTQSYFKVYDWAVNEWKGNMFSIIPFDDEHANTIDLT